jgi:hypothetical protein
MRAITVAALLALAGGAVAAPVYLDCVKKYENPPPGAAREFRFSVKIDEANGTITHTDADGSAFNAEGFFTAREVGYKHEDGDASITERVIAYTIDRANLTFTRTYTARLSESGRERLQSADELKRVLTIRGACKIMDVKNRKF